MFSRPSYQPIQIRGKAKQYVLSYMMSQDGSQPSGSQPSITQLHGTDKQVSFNEHGQPIGEGSEQFSTGVGRIAKTHCPPAYDSWNVVPDDIKEQIWISIVNQYGVPEIYKRNILNKANISWKNWKSELRKHCDKFSTDAERKRNPPKRIKKEEWEAFVEKCSTEKDQALREKGKAARGNMKSPHTSGRTGAARTAEKLKKESPTGEITRTELFLATHTKKDGSCPFPSSQNIEEIRRLVMNDPYLGQKDLDHDPVAKVYGRDGKGRVRGMGSGVSKTAIRSSAPCVEIARREKRACESLKEELGTFKNAFEKQSNEHNNLREQVAKLTDMVQSNHGSMPESSVFRGSSKVRGHSIQECPNFPSTFVVKNLRKRVVALGRINNEATPSEDTYNIILDGIYERNENLYDKEETFGDIDVGDTINWPKPFVDLIRL